MIGCEDKKFVLSEFIVVNEVIWVVVKVDWMGFEFRIYVIVFFYIGELVMCK